MSGRFDFRILAEDPSTRARRGRLFTRRGTAETPAFMPVATAAAMKGIEPARVRETGSEIILCNTYHLEARPGSDLVAEMGGLHRFMGWNGPILTDSGGYQVFSLAGTRRIDDDGVTFKNPGDGSLLRLTPERAMEIQLRLDSDILMVFDECLPADAVEEQVRNSLIRRTIPWGERCLALHPGGGRAVFVIGQGGLFAAQRRFHAERLLERGADGFAIGGLSVGETSEAFAAMIRLSTGIFPREAPRYLMGVGSLPEILEAVELGVDMFDCVLPTRNARNGQALTFSGPLRIRNRVHRSDGRVLEEGCPCSTCSASFSRAYLRHLFMAGEMLGPMLMTAHNLAFMQRLMDAIRRGIEADRFATVKAGLLAGWRSSA